MKSITAKIIDPIGIHARPASQIAQEASKFQSKVEIKANSKSANARSIINIMALGIKKDTEIELVVDGPDEETALSSLVDLMKKESLIK